jgi:hypothetical protein
MVEDNRFADTTEHGGKALKGKNGLLFPEFAYFPYFSCRLIALHSLHKLYPTRRMYEK